MIVLKGLYDSNNKRLIINFTCSLLQDYSDIFDNVINKYKKAGFLPNDLETQKLDTTKFAIVIPIDIPEASGLENGDRITNGIPKDLVNKISLALEDFRNLALEKEFKNTEFIPLQGYSLKNLQTDIVEAIKNKRNFCLIDNYSDYQKFSRHEITKINQCKIIYSSNDYSEVALYIYEGNMKGLREMYTPKLKETDWE